MRSFNPAANRVLFPQDISVLNGKLYFFVVNGSVNFGQTRNLELWTSDGSTGGTVLVKDFGADPLLGAYSANFKPIVVNGSLLFAFTDGANGLELFSSDGTAAGTRKLIDLNPNGGSNPGLPIVVGNQLIFRANDGVHGFEFWKTNSTSLGTSLIHDVNVGTNDANPLYLGILGGKALVLAQVTDNNFGLFTTDGTAAGTHFLKDLHSTPQISTILVETSAPTTSATVGNKIFFTAGSRLWVTDGTTGGTTLVQDFANNPLGIQPDLLQATSGRLFFIASTYSSGAIHSRTIWTSDGVTTTALGTFTDNAFNRTLTVVGNVAYFTVHVQATGRDQLWASDGTVAGTQPIAFAPLINSVSNLTSFNGSLYFLASTATNHGIWRSNGTVAGTTLVIRDRANAAFDITGSVSSLMVAGGHLYLQGSAFPGAAGSATLWITNGTPAGTTLLQTINVANAGGFNPFASFGSNFAALGNRVFFKITDASDFTGGFSQLWVTDNTFAGTHKVTNLPFATGDRIITSGDHVYFTAAGDGTLYELWQSDGTNTLSIDHEVGTHIVADINPGALSGIPDLNGPLHSAELNGIDLNGTLLFTADDGFHGAELWKVDCPIVNADLAVTQTVSPDTGSVLGQTVTYTLHVVNNGPDAADATLTDLLPDGVTVLGISASKGQFTQNGNVLTFHLGNLIAGASASATIQVLPNAAGPLTAMAHVFSAINDPHTENNLARTTVNITETAVADLNVKITGTPAVI